MIVSCCVVTMTAPRTLVASVIMWSAMNVEVVTSLLLCVGDKDDAT